MSEHIVSLVPLPPGWVAIYLRRFEGVGIAGDAPHRSFEVKERPCVALALYEDGDRERRMEPVVAEDGSYHDVISDFRLGEGVAHSPRVELVGYVPPNGIARDEQAIDEVKALAIRIGNGEVV